MVLWCGVFVVWCDYFLYGGGGLRLEMRPWLVMEGIIVGDVILKRNGNVVIGP